LVAYGGVLAFLAVALGAFGTHGLRDRLSPEMLAVWYTGAEYQMAHALAMILAGLAYRQMPQKQIAWAGGLFGVGVLIFSGSLYALALSGVRVLGAITPLGGLCFLVGWLLFVYGASKTSA
jgi:uncharacterized membrane protein YgdD (TMEM256/DUF423 family)